jgi:hypothetical protein
MDLGINTSRVSEFIKNVKGRDAEVKETKSEGQEKEVEKSDGKGYKFSISPEAAKSGMVNKSLVQVSISIIQSIQNQNGDTQTTKIDINAMMESYQIPSELGIGNFEDFTSPESTASRIFNFSQGRWGKDHWGEEDTKELRTKYRDYIMPAIKEGYKQARGMLGILPEDVASKLEKTMSLIDELYNKWIDDGGKETQQTEAVAQ